VVVKVQETGGQLGALEVDHLGIGGFDISASNLGDDSFAFDQQPGGNRVRGLGVQQRRVLEQRSGQAMILAGRWTEETREMRRPFTTIVTSAQGAGSRFVWEPPKWSQSLPTEQDLEILSRKLTQLKLAYDQYFLGSRPREPIQQRDEIQKAVVIYSNQPMQNTMLRFKFSAINFRYQAFNRQWTETLRKIERGTYERHQFRAKLHERPTGLPPQPVATPTNERREIYDSYVKARRSCGHPIDQLSPQKLDAILDKQKAALCERFGDCEVTFRVVVEDGKAKLKARRTA